MCSAVQHSGCLECKRAGFDNRLWTIRLPPCPLDCAPPYKMDLKSLSSNWKRLQQQLDKDRPPKKRKVSSAREGSTPSTRKRMELTTSKSLPDLTGRAQEEPANLELWASENDISVADLRDAYGTIPKRSSSVPARLVADRDNINKGLSATYVIRPIIL